MEIRRRASARPRAPFDFRRAAAALLLPVAAAAVVSYFAYHAVQGRRGVLAYAALKSELQDVETALSTLRAERQRLEHRVDLLKPPDIDRDMLEELAFRTAALIDPNDTVVMTTDLPAPNAP